MTIIVCDITATRQETLAKDATTNSMVLSLTDVSSIKIGSSITFNNQLAYVTGATPALAEVSFYVPVGTTFTPKVGDIVTIESVFRFATEDVVMSLSGKEMSYEGRLSVPSINESFGSFLTRNQIVSNANINLINTDRQLTNIFHNYDLSKNAKVELLFGETNDLSSYTNFFTGIATISSGFTFNDSTFSFSAKDNRAILLNTPIPANSYSAANYPDFAIFGVGMPVLSIVTPAIPAGWAAGTAIHSNTGASAIVSYISATTLYLYNYNGNFLVTDTILSDQGGSTTITSIVSPLGTNLIMKGDSGRFLSNKDDNVPVINNLPGGTTMSYYTNNTRWGFFHAQIPLPATYRSSFVSTKTGYLESVTVNVTTSTNIKTATVTISAPGFTVSLPGADVLISAGSQIIDTKALNLKVLAGQTVTVTISTVTISGNLGVQIQAQTFTHRISSVSTKIVGHYNSSGSLTTIIPVNFGLTAITGPGNLFFSRSNSFVKVFVSVSSDNGTTYVPVGSGGQDVNSGVSIPELVAGTSVTTIKITANLNSDPSFRLPAELYGLEVQYPTGVITGSTLSNNSKDNPIPVLYGDFRDSKIPVTKLTTVSDNTLGAQYTFSAPTTNSLYFQWGTTATTDFSTGDTIEYGAVGHAADKIYAKITQVIATSAGVGTLYFEDFGIVPLTSGVKISRETNTYKLTDHPILSIDSVTYKPKSSKKILNIPTSSVVTQNLANGEFSIVGVNAVDQVFASCRGKPVELPILGTAEVTSTASLINLSSGLFITNGVTTGSIVTNIATGETVDIVSVTETTITTVALLAGTWSLQAFKVINIIEDPISIINDIGISYNLGISTVVKGSIANELKGLRFRRYIDTATNFGDLLGSIELSANLHISITANNVLTLMRFTDTIVPEVVYQEHNVIPNSLDETYDPDGVAVSSATFQYNYDFQTKKYGSDYLVGPSGALSTTMKFDWLYKQPDVANIGNQVFKVIKKLPEIIHVTIAAADALAIKLGDVTEVTYLGIRHILFIYDIIRNPAINQVELYGWVLSNSYDIAFPIPPLAEFPGNIMFESGWSESAYTQELYSLFDEFGYDELGVPDINLIAPSVEIGTGVTTSSTVPISTPVFKVKMGDSVVGNPGITIATDPLPAGVYNVTYKIVTLPASYSLGIYTTLLTGLIPGSADGILPFISRTLSPAAGPYTQGALVTQQFSILEGERVFISSNVAAALAIMELSDITITPTFDRNPAYDRYNYWNPTWPFIMKQYVLDRYNIEVPKCGYISSLASGREYVTKYKA